MGVSMNKYQVMAASDDLLAELPCTGIFIHLKSAAKVLTPHYRRDLIIAQPYQSFAAYSGIT